MADDCDEPADDGSDDQAGHVVRLLRDILNQLTQMENNIMTALADLQAAVANETTVDQSVITLLNTLAADLTAALAANDTPAIEAVVTTMTQNAAALSAAVTANTPAAPATATPPTTPPATPPATP